MERFLKGRSFLGYMIPTVELHPRKIDDINRQPKIETRIYLSKDGKWVIHKTIFTDFKPRSYIEIMMEKEKNHNL